MHLGHYIKLLDHSQQTLTSALTGAGIDPAQLTARSQVSVDTLEPADALYQWAFTALGSSPGARAYYDTKRAAGATHHAALRALTNRLVGLLHGCLRHERQSDEASAWPNSDTSQAQAA